MLMNRSNQWLIVLLPFVSTWQMWMLPPQVFGFRLFRPEHFKGLMDALGTTPTLTPLSSASLKSAHSM
ncbi:Uncharacterised protein [Vibrio cholerae]|nr:Uncharacterised protein [Vibrio cholerae]